MFEKQRMNDKHVLIWDICGHKNRNLPNLTNTTNIGKRTSYCDFQNSNELENFMNVLSNADVFINSYRPDCLSKFGLDPKKLAEKFPGLIIVEVCAFLDSTADGVKEKRRGYDSIVQSSTGIAYEHTQSILGDDWLPDESKPPKHLPVSALDYLTGYLGAAVVIEALNKRKKYSTEHGGKMKSIINKLSLLETSHYLVELGRKESYDQKAIENSEWIDYLCKSDLVVDCPNIDEGHKSDDSSSLSKKINSRDNQMFRGMTVPVRFFKENEKDHSKTRMASFQPFQPLPLGHNLLQWKE